MEITGLWAFASSQRFPVEERFSSIHLYRDHRDGSEGTNAVEASSFPRVAFSKIVIHQKINLTVSKAECISKRVSPSLVLRDRCPRVPTYTRGMVLFLSVKMTDFAIIMYQNDQ